MFSPLEITVGSSARISVTLVILGFALLTLLATLPAPTPELQAGLMLIALAQFFHWWRTYANPVTGDSIHQLLVQADRHLQLRVLQRNGKDYLLPQNAVWLLSAKWIILRGGYGKPAVVLTTDNCDNETLRRLRVLLRLSIPQIESDA
ncbi:MAG: hypothetical protein IPM37_21395 [Hahellaceae bacterium]|nr:hypothetical protein [Hahellaceae bacterium]